MGESTTTTNLAKGFEATGIFPLDRNSLITKLPIYAQDISAIREDIGEQFKVFIENTFRNPKPEVEVTDDELVKIDPELFSHLMVFQKEGVRFGLSKCGRCLLADDMGLGKTIQALGIMHYYRGDWPLLIVCPSSVRYDWLEAIQTWLPTIPTHHVEVMTSGKDDIGGARILITSYDLMSRYGKQWLAEKSFGAVIMDESHFLKSFKSARTKVAILFFKQAKRVLLLSGTPALSRPSELYTQIAAIDPKAFGSFHDFGLRYCAAVKTNWAWDYSGSSNMVELHLLLEKRFMIRRLKSNVISELPPKIRELVILNRDMIKGTNSEMKGCEKALNVQGLRGLERRGALLSYYCATGKAKLPAIVDYICDLLDTGRKFICFAHHQIVLDGICEAIEERNLSYIRIDGSTPSEVRKQHCDLFQYNDEVMVAVLSITAANSGITLTSAHLVVFAELFWNPGILTQAEDRAHRLGQQDSVLVRYLVARGTADDHLWPLIQAKLDVLNKAGLSKDNFLNSHSTEMKSRQQKSLVDFFEELIEDEENRPIGPQFETNQPAPTEEDNSAELWEVDEEDLLAKIDLEQIEQIESKKRRMNESATQKYF
uniref:SWI/SNF-related matrix-associated actin-dependent regulator of chromatin subfamily A-like protein 1 n=1 Tax=Timema cristinae TaxID=61476 RepID=A0A7R9GVM3_TIMCR|nr:unnamed protein product [Timema cristinae]